MSDPQHLGPWVLDAEIGRGGMGVVWAAHRADGSFEQEVAIKLLPPLFANPLLRSRFARETQALARLSHPNIARLFDAGQTEGGTTWLAMERVHGESLTRHVHEQQVGLRGRLALLLQLCDAVTHAHRHLLVHRDLKPGNVLVTPAGQVKLLDFGVAWLLDEADSTRLTQGIGAFTPGYASPEQTDSTDVSTAADVFALGVLLYELITDSHPFIHSGDTLSRTLQRTLQENPLAPSRQKTALAGVDADLDAITLHALEKRPQDRLSSP
ncbi:serine/threonine-protein kinase, partial [Ideonella sp.]|uniref:serine/threonine-protein kinase n=1 Tax=Ideonella sp. TaxID=1929293 RepID=UPI003BB5194E